MRPRFALTLPAALLTLGLLATPAAAEGTSTTFADTAGRNHEAAVAALVTEGVVQGCGGDRFCSDDVLTRGQLATMLVQALGLETGDVLLAERGFEDSGDSAHAGSIVTLAAAGIVGGCGGDRFCPSDPVTREQLATMLFNALELPAAAGDARFFIDVGDTHGSAVDSLADQGFAGGCGPVTFCPRDEVSRAHAALFLARSLGLVEPVELAAFEDRMERHEELERERERLREERLEQERQQARQQAIIDRGKRVVDVAMGQLGTPYGWGGNGPHRFDCSGLTSFAWRAVGVELPRTSRDQHARTTRITRSELLPGDLVFYHQPVSHVAIYIGDGKVVEAPNSGGVVRVRTDGLSRSGVVGFGRPGV